MGMKKATGSGRFFTIHSRKDPLMPPILQVCREILLETVQSRDGNIPDIGVIWIFALIILVVFLGLVKGLEVFDFGDDGLIVYLVFLQRP